MLLLLNLLPNAIITNDNEKKDDIQTKKNIKYCFFLLILFIPHVIATRHITGNPKPEQIKDKHSKPKISSFKKKPGSLIIFFLNLNLNLKKIIK